MNRRLFVAGVAALGLAPSRIHAGQTHIRAIARDATGSVGVYCRTLADGPPVIAYNESESFPAASTIKMVILTTAFAMEERQAGALDETVVARRRDLIGGSPYMQTVPDGARVRVRDLIVPMIQVSDNTASNALMGHFGFDAINAVGKRAGMLDTRLARRFLDYTAIVNHHDNVTTPYDMGTLLFTIARSAREERRTIVSPGHAKRMIDIMLGQTDRDGIPAGLPRGTRAANKTGEIAGTRNDVAIVEPFGDSPYILAFYSKWVRDYAAVYGTMHRIARLSYDTVGKSEL
ncbi:MAG: class A beta-lactamase-related serine hydrolase [Candidatus Eremiobacteraeota bacterium]|nr:class A beta-lactamase-related serine hydrolase [Candidatus Eremiobacteraeota bacterium]